MKLLGYILFFIILNVNYTFSQAFKVKLSKYCDKEIGSPVLALNDGGAVFYYKHNINNKKFISLFDKMGNVLINNLELVSENIDYANYSAELLRWREVGNKVVVDVICKMKLWRVDLNRITGKIESEKVICKLNSNNYHIGSDKYNKIENNTKYRSIVQSELNQTSKKELNELVDFNGLDNVFISTYDSLDNLISKVDFDFVNHSYQYCSVSQTLFQGNSIFIVSDLFKITSVNDYENLETGQYEKLEGSVYISRYDINTKNITHKSLFDTKKYGKKIEDCRILQNNGNSLSYLIFTMQTDESHMFLTNQTTTYYNFLMLPFDLTKMIASNTPSLFSSEKLNAFVNEHCNMKNGYEGGMINNVLVDKKNNLFFTKIKNVDFYTTSRIHSKNQEIIGVSYFDTKGKEIFASAYPYPTIGYEEKYNRKGQNVFDFSICVGTRSNFIFLNNLPENLNLPLNQKPKKAKELDKCNLVVVELTENGNVKQYNLFGEPKENENIYGDFENALYDQDKNILLLKVYEGPNYKNARATWINFN